MGRKLIDITGQKFNYLTAIEHSYIDDKKNHWWKFKCDCGNEKIYKGNDVKRGRIKSCGCMQHKHKLNKFYEKDNYIVGVCSDGNEFYIDKIDYDKVKNYTWTKNNLGYFITTKNKKCYLLHRVIMDCIDNNEYEVDHIHGKESRFDNRRENLRLVTHSQNNMNKPLMKNNKSGYQGICFSDGKWHVQLKKINEKTYHKRFDNLKDAINARNEIEKQYFGEYSYSYSQEM